jgi:magnesium-transporting ATPase (P-type)
VIDEASLTGESDPIKKNPEEDPWCRSGTQVGGRGLQRDGGSLAGAAAAARGMH